VLVLQLINDHAEPMVVVKYYQYRQNTSILHPKPLHCIDPHSYGTSVKFASSSVQPRSCANKSNQNVVEVGPAACVTNTQWHIQREE